MGPLSPRNFHLFSGNFLKLNHEILERYSACSTAAEVIEQQKDYMAMLEQESSASKSQDMTDIDFSVETSNPNRQVVPEFSDSSEEADFSEEADSSEEEEDSEESDSEEGITVDKSADQSSGPIDHVTDKVSSVTFLDQDEVYDL